MSTDRKTQRGIALVTMALWMTAFLAFAVVGVDIGRLAFSANEVQAIADIAASAGAVRLMNGGDAAQVKSDAQTVVRQNIADGRTASIAANDVITGIWDQGTFTASAPPNANAVRATGRLTVQNVLASVLGSPTSDVTRAGTAAVQGLGSACKPGGPRCLPFGPTKCVFPSGVCLGPQGCTLPLIQGPSTANNSAFTSFFSTANGVNDIVDYFPTECGGSNKTIQHGGTEGLSVGDVVNVSNGNNLKAPKLFDAFQCAMDGGQKFLVPVFDTSCPSGPVDEGGHATVYGFATVTIVNVDRDAKTITMQAVFSTDGSGTPGGSCLSCGTTYRYPLLVS